jgi:glycosyltransferase involved in cell wall biosynthesis
MDRVDSCAGDLSYRRRAGRRFDKFNLKLAFLLKAIKVVTGNGPSMPMSGQTESLRKLPRRRATLLTNMPAPYRLPFFKELGERCDCVILFDDISEQNRQWQVANADLCFPHRFLRGVSIPYPRRYNLADWRSLQLRYDIVLQLFKLRPDIVVSAEMGARSLQAALYCWMTKTPLIIWWEGTVRTEGSASALKTSVRRHLVRCADRYWSNGADSTALLMHYGAARETIDEGMTGIDTIELRAAVHRLQPNRDAIRSELGLRGTVIFYAGRLVERKGILQFLRALDRVCVTHEKFSLLVAGSGSLEPDIRKWASEHPGVPVVTTGFVQPADLARYFVAADVFVLPTLDDNWSLVSLEALVTGLPQLFSIYNGATAELLRPGVSGVLVDPDNMEQFEEALSHWIGSPPNRIPADKVDEFVKYYSAAEMAARAVSSFSKLKKVS